jgi:altronate hydrolase
VQRTIDEGVRAVLDMLPRANDRRRTPQPISKIALGTNCGGSDGYSGVTANPALGVVSDLLAAHGGASILAETTEIYGAEHLLAARAASPEVAAKLLERIAWWEWYTATFGARIDNNPSHGNKAGGLTTIFEKSLGAVAKAGSSPLVDVVGYAEPVTAAGLTFMDTPGFDPVSVTGIVAGGANVVAFTTGRGSVLGSKPAPTIKIATNTPLYERMEPDMDFDAGTAMTGDSVAEIGRRLFELVLRVASGAPTKSERQNLGDDEFVPWTVGPVL